MRVEDKRDNRTTFDKVNFGEVFQVIDVDPSFRNKYYLQIDADRFVNIQTGESFCNDIFYDDYGIVDEKVKVVILNAKLVIE